MLKKENDQNMAQREKYDSIAIHPRQLARRPCPKNNSLLKKMVANDKGCYERQSSSLAVVDLLETRSTRSLHTVR